ncbi:BlaI/MecI/CopY family transcriptional regulator [Gordonia zhaorongruii]|uniref:BlaI/MecI/CopY family transcriptional regulator n=1 Tax=Gordonia zhaorongruii TaxID=2597659 RepID=UPI001F3EC36D|nr:BlaI/MecI/CopY family transcriptional regulator [Gordonia zhaorongruii]
MTDGQPVRLGPLEQQVMDILWDGGPSTIRQIIDALPNAAAYTTIATVLRNLERKKLVGAQRRRRSVQYRPRYSRDVHTANLMNQALASSKDRAASILHFVDGISDDDAALLREYLTRAHPEDRA